MQIKKLKVLKEECDNINIIDNDTKENKTVEQKHEVNVVGTLLSYKGANVSIIKNVLGEDWWKAAHVTKPLAYAQSDQTIRHVVSSFNKKSYGELLNCTPLESRGVKLEKDLTTLYI